MADRFWSETPQATAGRHEAIRLEVMYVRTAVLLEILLERRVWPTMVRALPRL